MEPGRKRFSPVWVHFDQISPEKVKCLLCNRELGYNNNTSSMLRHLRALHENVEENLEEPSQVTRKRELDDALISMIVRDKQPFSIVENKGFRDFVAKLDPTYVLPTQKDVKAMMDCEYQEELEVKSENVTMAEGHLMEVCVDSVESAVNAERGGAGRIELCSSLLEGGLTPSLGLVEVVKERIRIPVYVMIRPRGGDFLYSHQEVQVMKKDIQLMRRQGVDGLVLGALTEDGKVDAELCVDLLASARPLPVTFHRAFDMVQDPAAALETLITLGFERVLTSGCDSSALEGLPLIKKLNEQAKGRIIIMPGGGITERNLQRILEGSGAQEFHCSARSSKDSAMVFRNNSVLMGAAFSAPEYGLKVADMNKVRILNAIARNIL